MKSFFQKGQVVLFQGDSVTDCGRNREDITSLSEGYPGKIAAIYNTLFPDADVKFVNKGVSGDRVHNLIMRYIEDIREIEPDFISILIGINDVWRRYDSNDPTTVDSFKDHYEYLLKMIKKDFPNARIMLIEPFVLHSLPDRESWHEDLDPKIQVVRALARDYADYYLPMDGIFASLATNTYSLQELAPDGVHPSDLGHAVIADAYLKALEII